MVKAFDAAIEKMLPTVAKQYDIDPREYTGKGLDAGSYVGDEGGALWKGLCQAKGREKKKSERYLIYTILSKMCGGITNTLPQKVTRLSSRR